MNGIVNYEAEITGMPVKAQYTRQNVETVFLPLMHRLQELRERKNGRVLVFLAAPPAAGKSTLASFLASLCPGVSVLAMDGFHHYQDYLLAHSTVRGGQTVPMVSVKGAPETFDLPKLAGFIRRAASGEEFGWPAYDRSIHNPVEDAVTVSGDILLLEGNYLLLDMPGWRELRQYADYTLFIRADESILRPRLVRRKLELGRSQADAEAFADASDLPNARLVLNHSLPADLTFTLTQQGEYSPS